MSDTTTVAAALGGLGAATLGESGAHVMSPRIRAAWPGARVVGRAYPVVCGPVDNLAVHAAVAEAPAGSVLCVEIEGEGDRGLWGEVLTTGAEARGILGLVIDGGVRDVDALEAHGFPVFSTGIVLRGATKHHSGSIGIRSVVGDVEVRAGDWIVGDRDGVVVVWSSQADEVVAAGRARDAKEASMFEALRGGSTTVDLLGLDTSVIERPAG
jgi:4-hydroxy-4-methyl-2-oxoglutarate aldolase